MGNQKVIIALIISAGLIVFGYLFYEGKKYEQSSFVLPAVTPNQNDFEKCLEEANNKYIRDLNEVCSFYANIQKVIKTECKIPKQDLDQIYFDERIRKEACLKFID